MHYFDIFVLSIVGLFVILGMRRGLVEELLKIIGLFVAILMAMEFVHPVAGLLANWLKTTPENLNIPSFILIVVLVMIGFRIAAALIKRMMRFVMLGWLDRAGGAIFGGIKALIILSLVLWVLLLLPRNRYLDDLEQNTITYSYVLGAAPMLYDTILHVFPGTEQFVQRFEQYLPTSGPDSGLARFNRHSPIDQLQEELGGQVDPDILRAFSKEKIQELLNDPELRAQLMRSLERQKQQASSEPKAKQEPELEKKVSKVF